MRTVLDGADRAVALLNEAVGRVIGLLVMVITAIVVYDVLARAVFGQPTAWAFDLTKHVYGAYFMLLGGYALRHKAHVTVDIVKDALSQRWRDLLEIVGYLLFFFPFLAVTIQYAWRFAERSWSSGETTWGVAQLPVYPVKIALVVGLLLLGLQGVFEFLRAARNLFRREG